MKDFYIKINEKYIPISFKNIVTEDWENKIVIVRVGSDELPADLNEIEETMEAINNADVLLENTSFIVTSHNLQFELLGSLKEVSEKYVVVTGNKTKDIIILPILTTDDYKKIDNSQCKFLKKSYSN